MDKRIRNEIAHLKKAVVEMLSEHKCIPLRQNMPSPIWSEALSVYSYLLHMSEEDFENIRFHTGLITGESIFAYWHPYPPINQELFAQESGYKLLTHQLPREFWIEEPPAPRIPRPLGVLYKDKIINHNIVRYQKCISNLYQMGVILFLLTTKTKRCVLEIGAGYGGLAHSLGSILGDKITYIIVDLPEMLLFSGSYLLVNNPGKKIYVYQKNTFDITFLENKLWKYDYVLLPHYLLECLHSLAGIDLALNLQSFQEMTEKQIEGYLSLLSQKVGGVFYSDNLDKHPYNSETINITKMLQRSFHLFPGTKFYELLHQKLLDPRKDKLYKTYIASTNGSWLHPIENSTFYVSCLDPQNKNKFILTGIPIQDIEKGHKQRMSDDKNSL